MFSLISSYGLENDTAAINIVNCNTNYLVVLRCSHNDNTESCTDEDIVSVKCGKQRERGGFVLIIN